MLRVRGLGTVPYHEADALQHALVHAADDYLLVLGDLGELVLVKALRSAAVLPAVAMELRFAHTATLPRTSRLILPAPHAIARC